MFLRAIRTMGALAGLLSITACSVFGSAAAPEPDYRVVRDEAPFELRDYDELVGVRTPMSDGSRAAFGRLFDYISGANSEARDIAMTAPVLNVDGAEGTKIAMTAPVLQTRDGAREMVFLLPDAMTLATAPAPTHAVVTLTTIPPRRVAVVRYSGSLEKGATAAEARLRAWIARKDLTPTGPAEVAGYNPPWTLPPNRRNEILIPVEKD